MTDPVPDPAQRSVGLLDDVVARWQETDLGVEGRVLDVVTAPAAVLSSVGAEVDPTAPATVQLAADLVATVQRSSVTGAVTGFELQGFAEDAVSVSVVEGPDLDACPGNGGGDQDGAWSRVPRSTERAQAHEGPALEVVHDGAAHPEPAEREEAA